MCKALYADKVETGQYREKKSVIKQEKGQIPFPTDRALHDADKLKTGLYRDNIHALISFPAPACMHTIYKTQEFNP